MSIVYGTNGHQRVELQALPMWLPGKPYAQARGGSFLTPVQICRFCWHHIKENLNGRCPACRREYLDDIVQFKPVNKEE